MALMNFAGLEGYLTDDTRLNHTKKGTPVSTFALANDYGSRSGKEYTDYPTVTLWGKQAEILHKYAGKGSLISVTGSNHTRHYQNKKGNTVYVQEILARNMQMLRTKHPNGSASASNTGHANKMEPKGNSDSNPQVNEQINRLSENDKDLPF